MYFSPNAVLAVALVGQATALAPAQPPSAALAVRGAVGQPGVNLESTPAMFRRGAVEARDPRGFGAGFKTGLKIWDTLRGGNNKRDIDEEADESAAFDEEADEEADEFAHLEARDPRGFGAGFKTGLKIWDTLRGNNNNKRDVDEEADEAAHLEARDPLRILPGGNRFNPKPVYRTHVNKRDVVEESAELVARGPRRGAPSRGGESLADLRKKLGLDVAYAHVN